jgi:trehalose 6-phosphate phosphatase
MGRQKAKRPPHCYLRAEESKSAYTPLPRCEARTAKVTPLWFPCVTDVRTIRTAVGDRLHNILGSDARSVLDRIGRARTLLAFDYDGTLAPIVSEPSVAEMRPITRTLLTRVADRFVTAVLSGRSRGDLSERLRGIGLASIIGNHGIETGQPSAREASWRAAVTRWRSALAELPERFPGIFVEDKGASLSVHYRMAQDPGRARQAIGRALEKLRGARIVGGKRVFNVVPATAETKGAAFERLIHLHRCALGLYAGDDVADEHLFRLRSSHTIGIRIGKGGGSAVAYYLENQAKVDHFLERLLDLPAQIGGDSAAMM